MTKPVKQPDEWSFDLVLENHLFTVVIDPYVEPPFNFYVVDLNGQQRHEVVERLTADEVDYVHAKHREHLHDNFQVGY